MFATEKMANMTDQDSYRALEEVHGKVERLEFQQITIDEWDTVMANHEADIFHVLYTVQDLAEIQMDQFESTTSMFATFCNVSHFNFLITIDFYNSQLGQCWDWPLLLVPFVFVFIFIRL